MSSQKGYYTQKTRYKNLLLGGLWLINDYFAIAFKEKKKVKELHMVTKDLCYPKNYMIWSDLYFNQLIIGIN